MALMYTDTNGILQGILRDVSFDADIGDGNDFLLTIPKRDYSLLKKGCLLFDSEDTEFGGMIDGVEVDTSADSVSFTGQTWQGILSQKVISPPDGEDYLTITGSTIYIMGTLVASLGLSDLFSVIGYDPESHGEGGAYQFNRYVTLLDGLNDFLSSRNLILSTEYDVVSKKVKITALPPRDFTSAQSFIKSPFNYKINKPFRPVNHMICLGKGELSQRTVIHLYLHTDGNIYDSGQQYTGVNEVVYAYENTSAESEIELKRYAIKKFEELIKPSIEILISQGVDYRIGDVIGGYEPLTKTQAYATITALILQINGNVKTISYKTQG